jgi:GNAT superfamily N-acetyltransferase
MRWQHNPTPVHIAHTRPEHVPQLRALLERVHDLAPGEYFTVDHLRAHIARFPHGQFVALLDGRVVGFAATMRTQYSPNARPLSWYDAVGDLTLKHHAPTGEWLYGVDFAVDPDYRNRGIGTALYAERFSLVKRLNLRGFYAGGMLQGYQRYRGLMTVREYAEKVIRGHLQDPTITMQLNRGFKPRALIEDYDDYPPSGNGALLIVWDNPVYPREIAAPA